MGLNVPLVPRPRRVRFTYRGPELAFAISLGDLAALKEVASHCCDFWNGANSLIIPIRRDGGIERAFTDAAAERVIDLLLVHPALGDDVVDPLERVVSRDRIVRLHSSQLEEWVHPLDLQPAYIDRIDPRPMINIPFYSRGLGQRLLPIAFGRFDPEDDKFYDRAFERVDADDPDLALAEGQLDGFSPLRQSTNLCRAYEQHGGSLPAKTLWVFERGSFSSLVRFWNARALMSVWGEECRVIALPRSALKNERVMERIRGWIGVRGRGRMKPELLITGDTSRARNEAIAAVEALGISRTTAARLTQYFGDPPAGREAPEYWFFQWVDGPLSRGLVVDDIEVIGAGRNSFFVQPPAELRFRDHGGHMFLDIHELPVPMPLNRPVANLVYSNGVPNRAAVSIRTLLPRGRHLLEPTVPEPDETLRAYFSHYGYVPRLSQDGVLADTLLDRFEERRNLDVLADEHALAILEDLAPDHRKKLARRLARELGKRMSEKRLAELLRREAAFIELQARTLEQLASRIGCAETDLTLPLATLVERGLVGRGAAVRCPQCRMRQFIALRDQDEQISCSACRFEFTLPVLADAGVREHPTAYRLDGLMARAMDQDVLAPLLAVRWALQRVANPPEGGLWPGLELLRQDQVIAEVDVVASDRSQLVFIEAKRGAGGASRQKLSRFVRIAREVGASVVCAAMSGTFSDAVQRFAERNDVLLLERDVLLQQ